MISIEQIYKDYGIYYEPQQNGWINTTCPFCDDTKAHLGCAPDSLTFNCWRCGWHPTKETIAKLLNIRESDVSALLKQYNLRKRPARDKKEFNRKINIHPFRYPEPYDSKLGKVHKKYLKKRGFDPIYMEKEWDLISTGPVSFLDKLDYKYRIIIPIIWNGEVVSFQSRDVTEQSKFKYMVCPPEREKIHHKNIIYGNQEYWEYNRVGIITEGVTDVWKLGPLACATFGMKFTMPQVLEMAHQFDRIFIVFDSEKQAQKQAKKLAIKLRMLRKEVYIQTVGKNKDPGDLTQEDADHFVRQLIGRGKQWPND